MQLDAIELSIVSDKLLEASALIHQAGTILANRRVQLDGDLRALEPHAGREIGRMVKVLSCARQEVNDVESTVYQALNEDRKGGVMDLDYTPSTCQPAWIKATVPDPLFNQ